MRNESPGTVYGDGECVIGIAADGTHVNLGTLAYLSLAKVRDAWVTFDAPTLAYLVANPSPERW